MNTFSSFLSSSSLDNNSKKRSSHSMFAAFSEFSATPATGTSALHDLLSSGGIGGPAAQSNQPPRPPPFSLDGFVMAHPDAAGAMLGKAFGLRDLVELRGDDDDAGSIFNPRYTDSTEGETTESSDGDDDKKNVKTKVKKGRRRRIVISKAMPAGGRRTAVEVCSALHQAALLRDLPLGGDATEAAAGARARRTLIASCCTSLVEQKSRDRPLEAVEAVLSDLTKLEDAVVQCAQTRQEPCSGLHVQQLRALVVDHLTRPFEPIPTEDDVDMIFEATVMPILPLLYPVRPVVARQVLAFHHARCSGVLDLGRTVETVEMTRWRLLDAFLEDRLTAFVQGSIRSIAKRIVRLKLVPASHRIAAVLKGCGAAPGQHVDPTADSSRDVCPTHPAIAAMFGSLERMESMASRLVAWSSEGLVEGRSPHPSRLIDALLYWEVLVAALESDVTATAS